MEMKTEPMIEVRNLCKTYIVNKKQNNVLRNVNFIIRKGEMVGVMGPSGSGKSTLLYTVSGMDKMTAGEVLLHGNHLSHLKENEMAEIRLEEMGFIFQQMYMMKNLSILDNIILPAVKSKKLKESRKETEKRGRALMHKLGIEDIADHDINEASGGQLQRACICRSMMNHPNILFADEPTGALNRASSDEVMTELVNLNREGTTVMLVTHDVKVAAQCSRVLYIVDGDIQGEYTLGTYEKDTVLKDRERELNHWLMDMGW